MMSRVKVTLTHVLQLGPPWHSNCPPRSINVRDFGG